MQPKTKKQGTVITEKTNAYNKTKHSPDCSVWVLRLIKGEFVYIIPHIIGLVNTFLKFFSFFVLLLTATLTIHFERLFQGFFLLANSINYDGYTPQYA